MAARSECLLGAGINLSKALISRNFVLLKFMSIMVLNSEICGAETFSNSVHDMPEELGIRIKLLQVIDWSRIAVLCFPILLSSFENLTFLCHEILYQSHRFANTFHPFPRFLVFASSRKLSMTC